MKKLLLGTFFGAIILLLVQINPLFASSYGGAWLPNEGEDINYFSMNFLPIENPYELWMCDFGNTDEKMMILGTSDLAGTVTFTHDSSWQARKGSNSITLGNSKDFGILFRDKYDNFFSSYTLTPVIEGESYCLSMNGIHHFLQVDAAPHSIPDASAMFLLGSACLVGFGGGLRRKFKG